MADFAIKNLMEIEDASSRPEVEARFSRKFLDSEHLGISHFRYAPGAPSVVRGFEGGPEGLELIAVGSGRPEGGDGALVADRWPRDDS